MDPVARLKHRRVGLTSRSYLVYTSLWPKLDAAISSEMARRDASTTTVLDVGCGERPYEDLFGAAHYVGLNFGTEGASPDVLGDAQRIPIASESVDIVFSTQVIEHVPSPTMMIAETWRVLRPGGALILSGPFYWPLHEEPFDFFRFTRYGLEHLLGHAGFEEITVDGDCGALTQVAVSVIEVLPRALRPLIPLINVVTPWLQARSRNTKSTLNYVVRAVKGSVSPLNRA